MNVHNIRTLLALVLVGGFSIVCFLIVILVTTGFLQSRDGTEILKTFSSVYSGFVGLIIGYYFGKHEKE